MKLRSAFNKVVLGLVLVTSFASFQGCSNDINGDTYSEGDRVGTVAKLSHKGLLNKSWEGQLAMDSFTQENSAMTNSFKFTVVDTSIVRQLKEVQESGERVKLHYKEVFWHNGWTADTPYFITKVAKTQNQSPTKTSVYSPNR